MTDANKIRRVSCFTFVNLSLLVFSIPAGHAEGVNDSFGLVNNASDKNIMVIGVNGNEDEELKTVKMLEEYDYCNLRIHRDDFSYTPIEEEVGIKLDPQVALANEASDFFERTAEKEKSLLGWTCYEPRAYKFKKSFHEVDLTDEDKILDVQSEIERAYPFLSERVFSEKHLASNSKTLNELAEKLNQMEFPPFRYALVYFNPKTKYFKLLFPERLFKPYEGQRELESSVEQGVGKTLYLNLFEIDRGPNQKRRIDVENYIADLNSPELIMLDGVFYPYSDLYLDEKS